MKEALCVLVEGMNQYVGILKETSPKNPGGLPNNSDQSRGESHGKREGVFQKRTFMITH